MLHNSGAQKKNPLSRQLASNAKLTRMIQDRISEGKELDGDCRDVKVESVNWHESDETGCTATGTLVFLTVPTVLS